MIRVAIVGTGGIAHAHMEAYLTLKERFQVVALVDMGAQDEHHHAHSGGIYLG